ncbi:MAG: helicase C-terminal domain-containing protein [Coriobacteriales bacterium]|nr:helicase C-terminal domain-containing protein [Coriobacteriales bacterium]
MAQTHESHANSRASGSAEVLDGLLLQGTTDEVRQRYHSLEERALTTSFGALEEDIIMLDTETTGLSFRNNELIEIAAARISGRTIVNTFRTFVHPTGPIPAEIQALTGITNVDVTDAPRAVDAVAALAEFVDGQPIVAHNATFDRTFIERVPGGTGVSDTWIDSLSLSRIALPRLRSHRLSDMAQAFGCDAVTHRAMADVEALCGMWRIMLLGLSDIPAGVLEQIAGMHEEVPWTYRPLLNYVAQGQGGTRLPLKDVRRTLLDEIEQSRKEDAAELTQLAARPVAQEVSDAFSAHGLVADMYESYEMRSEQLTMAQEVRSAFASSTHRAIEAGTGVGKSMAYLVPAVLFAQENGIGVGVATKTNALADQLMAHELPALDATLPGGVSFCNLKGYDHYPCLRRIQMATQRALPLERVSLEGRSEEAVAGDMLTALAVCLSYACQSPEGDLDALGIRWRYVPRDMVTASSSECLRSRCPFYPRECFVHGARRRAACSDVMVTNHSLLLRDVALEGAILPPIRHWIVDEAHSFEQEARRQWAKECSAEAAHSAFTTLGGINTGVLGGLLARSTKLDGSTLVAGLLTKAASLVLQASVRTTSLFEAIHELSALAQGGGAYDNTTLWIDDTVRNTQQWATVEIEAAQASEALGQATKALDEAEQALKAEAPNMAADLSDGTRSLKSLHEALKLVVLEPDNSYVCSAELYRAKKRMGRERLVAEKLNVGSDLAQNWYPEQLSVIYSSATMAVGKSFEHFNHAIGFDELPPENHRELCLSSSYDFDKNMSVVVASDLPAPNDRNYLQALEDLLFDVHKSMEGSVLTLFTNRREMELVYRSLSPRLRAIGLELACQERSASARHLRERFVAEQSLSLFALKSFWEGFDAGGDTLRCVVIPKLPFASPHDPLVRERELREQRAWWRYSLPEAVISVKQAAGRLIRSSTDTGILVLADSRICTKRYGQTFLSALPTNNTLKLESANVGRYIAMWRRTHEK